MLWAAEPEIASCRVWPYLLLPFAVGVGVAIAGRRVTVHLASFA
jgi:hypothetical protein